MLAERCSGVNGAGRDALPRVRRCRAELPFGDYAVAALYSTFTRFACCAFYERATPVARERNPTAGGATPDRAGARLYHRRGGAGSRDARPLQRHRLIHTRPSTFRP